MQRKSADMGESKVEPLHKKPPVSPKPVSKKGPEVSKDNPQPVSQVPGLTSKAAPTTVTAVPSVSSREEPRRDLPDGPRLETLPARSENKTSIINQKVWLSLHLSAGKITVPLHCACQKLHDIIILYSFFLAMSDSRSARDLKEVYPKMHDISETLYV